MRLICRLLMLAHCVAIAGCATGAPPIWYHDSVSEDRLDDYDLKLVQQGDWVEYDQYACILKPDGQLSHESRTRIRLACVRKQGDLLTIEDWLSDSTAPNAPEVDIYEVDASENRILRAWFVREGGGRRMRIDKPVRGFGGHEYSHEFTLGTTAGVFEAQGVTLSCNRHEFVDFEMRAEGDRSHSTRGFVCLAQGLPFPVALAKYWAPWSGGRILSGQAPTGSSTVLMVYREGIWCRRLAGWGHDAKPSVSLESLNQQD